MCQKFCIIVVVLSVAMALTYSSPVPGYLDGYHGLPAATSYSSRIDIHGPEYVKTYAAAPIVKTIIPSYHSEPLLGYSGYGYGLGHQGYGYGYGQYGHGHGLEHYY